MQILRNSGPAFVGTLYTDEWTVTNVPVVSGAIYNFDTDVQGWTNDTVTDLAVSALAWDSTAANAKAGAGSLLLTCDFSASLTSQGYIKVNLAATPLDLSAKSVDMWINVPAAMVGYGVQIACKTGAGLAWHGFWNNLSASGWLKVTCNPALADVQELGLQFVRNSTPAAFTGTLNVDEITYY